MFIRKIDCFSNKPLPFQSARNKLKQKRKEDKELTKKLLNFNFNSFRKRKKLNKNYCDIFETNCFLKK